MSENKIRKLTRKDRKTFGKLIKTLADKTGKKKLIGMVPRESTKPEGDEGIEEELPEDSAAKILSLAHDILQQILEFAEEDISEWFADLLGKTKEEYDNLDFDIEMDVVEQLLESKGFTGFFSRGSQVYSKIKGFASQYGN